MKKLRPIKAHVVSAVLAGLGVLSTLQPTPAFCFVIDRWNSDGDALGVSAFRLASLDRQPKITARKNIDISSSSTTTTASSFTEVGDTGYNLFDAQVVSSQSENAILTSISGTLSSFSDVPDSIDLFQIQLSGGSFSASTVGTAGYDTQLFLFDSGGFGVFANDNDPISSLGESTILAPEVPFGIYYLGITPYNIDPGNLSGSIFPEGGSADTMTVGPTGPGGAFPLSGYFGVVPASLEGDQVGPYQISLSGAEFVTIPEPCVGIGAWGLGLLCLMVQSRRKALR